MIYNADCLDILPTLDENSVDAVVTDPPYGLSFMGKDWDHGIPGVEFWKAAYRVMKPGAFLLSFGGTRTFHRLTCAIEDAGFEIRDCMMWLYGSGFPKSHDVSKAIDKAAGAEREVVGANPNHRAISGVNYEGTYAGGNTGAAELTAPSTDAAKQWSGWGTALKPAWEPIIVARKPLEGTVAQNVLKWGTGGMNIDGGRITVEETDENFRKTPSNGGSSWINPSGYRPPENLNRSGRWPANVILDEEAGAMLDGQSGISKSPKSYVRKASGNAGIYDGEFGQNAGDFSKNFGDTGGASRFFYCAKTSKKERGEGNNHPTVKPISLLTYLAKLVCPPGGTILDPFAGSGSTGVAAQNIGFNFIGIEKEKSYCDISNKRMSLLNEWGTHG